MLEFLDMFDIASIHEAGSTSWLDELPASSCKRGI